MNTNRHALKIAAENAAMHARVTDSLAIECAGAGLTYETYQEILAELTLILGSPDVQEAQT